MCNLGLTCGAPFQCSLLPFHCDLLPLHWDCSGSISAASSIPVIVDGLFSSLGLPRRNVRFLPSHSVVYFMFACGGQLFLQIHGTFTSPGCFYSSAPLEFSFQVSVPFTLPPAFHQLVQSHFPVLCALQLQILGGFTSIGILLIELGFRWTVLWTWARPRHIPPPKCLLTWITTSSRRMQVTESLFRAPVRHLRAQWEVEVDRTLRGHLRLRRNQDQHLPKRFEGPIGRNRRC